MRNLKFIVNADGSFKVFPLKKLISGEKHSDRLILIANKPLTTAVKVNYTVERSKEPLAQYLLPQTLKGRDFISQDKSYFQEYADANVWAINVDKLALQKFSRIASGELLISFSFREVVDAVPSGAVYKGDIVSDEVPQAENGEYWVIKISEFTVDDLVLNYGQVLLYDSDEWQKVGRYRLVGQTPSETLLVEPSVFGGVPVEDIDEEDVYTAIGQIAESVESKADQSEVDDIISGDIVVGAADKDGSDRVIENTYYSTFSYAEFATDSEKITLNTYFGTPSIDMKDYKAIVFHKATTTKAGIMTADDKAKLDNTFEKNETYDRAYIDGEFLLKEDKNKKGVADGYAPLDENAKLPLLYLYDSVLGQLEYVGTFNGVTVPSNTQNLTPNRHVRRGDYFIAIGSGIINGVDFKIGDWLVFESAVAWQKIDNTDAVASVNGKMGVVVLSGSDIEVGSGDTTKLQAKVVAIDQALGDIYRKGETFTRAEVLNLIDQLKSIYGWESSFVGEYDESTDVIEYADYKDYDLLVFNAIGGEGGILPKGLLTNSDFMEFGGIKVTHVAPDLLLSDFGGLTVKIHGYKMKEFLTTAENVEYDNTTSGLTAENLQTAVDEVVSSKQDNLTALTQADIDNKTEVPRVVTGKFIAENVLPQDTGWQDLSLINGWTNYIGHPLMIRKIGSIVQIKGIVNGSSKTDNVLCNIPLGYRPNRDLRYITWRRATANSQHVGIIESGGEVYNYGTQSDLVIDHTYFVG